MVQAAEAATASRTARASDTRAPTTSRAGMATKILILCAAMPMSTRLGSHEGRVITLPLHREYSGLPVANLMRNHQKATATSCVE